MPQFSCAPALDPSTLSAAIDRATRAVPPLWPLASSVAVNPFLGQAGETLASAGARLARVAGVPVTMPRHWYRTRIDSGAIAEEDLRAAWLRASTQLRPHDLRALRTAVATDRAEPAALPTLADLAAHVSGIDWPSVVADRFGVWASGYFDAGQALWIAPREENAYASWRAFATHDLTPEIAGLPGFPRHVTNTPGNPVDAIAGVVGRLRIPESALETYFHQLLLSLGGWSQFARYRQWQAGLAGTTDPTIGDLLAIRLVWEEALFLKYERSVAEAWSTTLAAHSAPVVATRDLVVDSILQDAAENAVQRSLAATLARESTRPAEERPLLQAAFCIDVRSEVFRRALESLDPRITTLGFAGFFGIATAHRRFASDTEERRLPVLLNPGLSSRAVAPEPVDADGEARVKARATRAWGRFKLAAVSSFAFVEAAGVLHVGSLLVDALGLRRSTPPDDPAPRLDPALDIPTRVRMAETVLRAMSLTSGFARLVLLAGHGASVVNNPHASGLNCGACGGYSGEVNARLLAGLLNDEEVRAALLPRGIEIPADTLFVAALHDTSTDGVKLYGKDHPATGHASDLAQAGAWLAAAGALARSERAPRLPRADHGAALHARSRDWAETRPEWGLAGCKAFIAAPRSRTRGKRLEGTAFLHDYDWRQDPRFSVLELILTAPVVVASWISLQYYASTVAPAVFGSGNKLLHNVTGSIGVVEGNGGLLRAGLPWQSVHDGETSAHDPVRLSVCIEAPREAIVDVLRRHEGVRALFDNGWLHLFALDDAGRMLWRYAGNLAWIPREADDGNAESLVKLAV